MPNEYLEKLRSINIGRTDRRNLKKETVDVHDHHKVKVTQHYDDRQDVTIKPDTIKLEGPKIQGGTHG